MTIVMNIPSDIVTYPYGWLVGVSAFLLLGCLVLILILYIHRTLSVIREKKENDLRFRYQYLLYDALVESQSGEATESFLEIALRLFQNEIQNKRLNQQILTDIILNLRKSLNGAAQNQFLDLAQALKLPEHSVAKLRQSKLSKQAQGLQEISSLDVNSPEIRKEVESLLASEAPSIAEEAAMMIVKLDSSPDLSFLSTLSVPLSEWMQIRLHHHLRTIDRHQLPDFSQWLNSDNESVCLFALRMIAEFKQSSASDTVLQLLSNASPEIVLEAINTITQLKLTEALPTLINLVQEADTDIQLASLRAIGELGDVRQITHLNSLRDHPDYWIRRATLEAVARLQPEANLQ